MARCECKSTKHVNIFTNVSDSERINGSRNLTEFLADGRVEQHVIIDDVVDEDYGKIKAEVYLKLKGISTSILASNMQEN